MKKSVIAAALLLVAAGTAVAQSPPPGPPPRGGPPIESLAKELGLDDTQKAEVKRIFEVQRSKMDAERAQLEASGTRPTREEMRARHEQNDTEVRQQLSTVLSAEQLAKFESMRKDRRPPRPPHDE